MGKLIKNHLARLIVLAAATYHVAGTFEAFFWPQFFFDFLTANFVRAVKPYPILQSINLVVALLTLAIEWPAPFVAGTLVQRSVTFRLFWLPLTSLDAVLLYQTTNPAVYYLIGTGVYFMAYVEGESICAEAWTMPKRTAPKQRSV